MTIRLTVDDAMKITDVAVGMPATPFPECHQANPPMQRLIGCTLGRGWRKAIEHALGGTEGCAHLRELLFNMATVGYQTIPLYRRHLRKLAGLPDPVLKRPPPHVGQCVAWDFNGAGGEAHMAAICRVEAAQRLTGFKLSLYRTCHSGVSGNDRQKKAAARLGSGSLHPGGAIAFRRDLGVAREELAPAQLGRGLARHEMDAVGAHFARHQDCPDT
jgi:hypothetical protein